MKTLIHTFLLCSFTVLGGAAEKTKDPIWTDVASATKEFPDFRLQGEYLGKQRGKPVGVQIACREGKTFLATTYPGGLPGAGNDGRSFTYATLDKPQLNKLIARLRLKK